MLALGSFGSVYAKPSDFFSMNLSNETAGYVFLGP